MGRIDKYNIDRVYTIKFNGLTLIMTVNGDSYETASIRFHLSANDGRPNLCDDVTIPANSLFDLSYLIELSARNMAMRYEAEAVELANRIALAKHPFKDIGGESGKESDKEKT